MTTFRSPVFANETFPIFLKPLQARVEDSWAPQSDTEVVYIITVGA